ncbi:PEGA domain-containing protein [Patescibacteria group bacterium]|nr:PEGA domain-containing protein [Patescibacteria group bacterium]MBU1896090.1 PEGA domain-containing protein [Patescibacteria group bacterium]
MTYPDTKLTKPIRRAIMISLFVCFFIISPIIILYTAGYRYDFEKNEIRQTGVISIDVKPNNVSVYLGGVLVKKNLPIRLTNRAPGTYSLHIEANGYQDWNKEITVESKQTTYVRDITLFKINKPIELDLEIENIKDVIFSYTGKYAIILQEKNNVFEISLLDIDSESLSPLSRSYNEVVPNISWSPFYPFVMIQTETEGSTQVQIIDARNSDLNNKTYTFSTALEFNYQWSSDILAPALFIQSGSTLYEANLNEISRLATIGIEEPWFVDKKIVWQSNKNNNTVSTLNGSDLNDYKSNNIIEKIIDINSDRLIAKTNQGIEIILMKKDGSGESKLITVDRYRYNSDTREWIAWSNWELWTIYPDGNTQILNRMSEAINQTIPLDQFGVLIFSTKNTLRAFNPGYYITHDLYTGEDINKFGINIGERKIYLWGKVENKNGIFTLDY